MKKRSYKAWTKEDETLLEALRWSEKYSIEQIADHMQRTESSIHNRIALLKLGTKKKIKLYLEPEQKFLDKYIRWVDRMVFRR